MSATFVFRKQGKPQNRCRCYPRCRFCEQLNTPLDGCFQPFRPESTRLCWCLVREWVFRSAASVEVFPLKCVCRPPVNPLCMCGEFHE